MQTRTLALVFLHAIAVLVRTEADPITSSPTPAATLVVTPKQTPAPTPTLRQTGSQILRQTKFICGERNGKPATMAKTSRGTIPMFLWQTEHFVPSDYDPQTRCQQVSARFQRYHTEGKLRYIGSDYLHNYPILCVADRMPGNCLTDRNGKKEVLVTLLPEHDPAKELAEVITIRDRAGEPITYYTGEGVAKYDAEGDLFIDLKKYAEELLRQYETWEELQRQFNSEVNNYIKPD
ncbi:MAG: hypothetical protein GDA38_23685 [Hormoscilla sp. SP12CHS1]|nr:hypothetical protein [Hormoscilla sp. SP12CHS1]